MNHENPHTNYQKEHGVTGKPYWRRAHHDWKFWVAIVVMLGAMWIYLRTNDLSVRPHAPLQHTVP